VKITAFDLVRMTHEVERVSASKIPDDQKTLVLTELRNAVPEPVFCASGLATRDYVLQTIEGALNGCAKNTKNQIPIEKGTREMPPTCAEGKLLRHSDEDGRGQSVTPEVVNKAPPKRRKTKRSA
jgi:hypothetical protein|tara:strand:+ start:235 stop:609 length:375 start_codon:yes stop_codon:yes gene_type:complete